MRSLFILASVILYLLSPSLSFSGADCDGTDDRMTFANQANFACTNATCTIAFWVNSHTTTGYYFARSGALHGQSASTDRFDMTIRSGGTNMTNRACNASCLSQGTWHHVAIVFTTHTTVINNNTITIYIDGVVNQSTLFHNGVDPAGYTPGTNPLDICTAGASSFKDAEIDDIHVYSAGLTADQVKILYASRARYSSIPVAHISYIPLECAQGAALHGTTQVDRSGSGNTLGPDDGANNTGMTCDLSASLMMHRGVE